MIPEVAAAAQRWQDITRQLTSLVVCMPPDRWGQPSACGGWTNRELLIHLATGYVVRIERLESALAGRAPAAVADIDEVNERNIAAWRPAPVEAIVAELLATRGRVLELLERLEPPHLDAEFESAGRSVRLGDVLSDLSAHDLEHAAQLRVALA